MEILLSPSDGKVDQLRHVYLKALRDATELYIASAYLTDWSEIQPIGEFCDQVVFIVGTDFGLTRKAAMRKALRWMPKHGSSQLLAVPNMSGVGFHPKIMTWRTTDGRHFAVIGSSNLSKAAFGGNYEANTLSEINSEQFRRIKRWLDPLILNSIPVTEDWIENHYNEARLKPHGTAGRSRPAPVNLVLPHGPRYVQAVHKRRKQQAAFRQIKHGISKESRRCAEGKISDSAFWKNFWQTWSDHQSRFQGSGIQFTGKAAHWQQACQALVTIIDAAKPGVSPHTLDVIVTREIDRLKQAGNPARGAWLSEMLCHYFPNLYPIRNAPVKKWLKANKYRGRWGSTEGQRYVELAKQLRHAVTKRPAGARNLAELDTAIWLWVRDRHL